MLLGSLTMKLLLIIVFYAFTSLLFMYQVVRYIKLDRVLRIQKGMFSLSFLLCVLSSISLIAFVYQLGGGWLWMIVVGTYLVSMTGAEMMIVYKVLCKPSQKEGHLIKSTSEKKQVYDSRS